MSAAADRTPRGVRFEEDGRVARIVLARPEASNAFDIPATLALREAIDRAEDGRYGAVLLTAEGPRFCAGGDITSFRAASEDERSDYLAELATMLEAELRRLSELSKPVVAAVHGAVAGAGLAFVLNADVTVAAQSTKFVFAYSGIGLTPDCGVSYLLPRAVGQARALEMAIGGRVLTGAEAQEWGLVARVAEDDEAAGMASALAAQLAAGPTAALVQARRLIRSSWDSAREDSAADEVRTIAAAVQDPATVALIGRFLSR